MIKFMHITSLQSAVSIMRTRQFHPVKNVGSDAGLNGLAIGKIGWLEQQFSGKGTGLIFEWDGPVEAGHSFNARPNVLFDQMPHRVFVPIGTEQHLRLSGFVAAPQTWEQHHVDVPWFSLGQARRVRARRRAMVQLQAEIDSIVETKPLVSVVA